MTRKDTPNDLKTVLNRHEQVDSSGLKTLKRGLWLIIVASLTIHVGILISCKHFLITWRWAHLPTHAVMETLGGAIAIMVASLLMPMNRRGFGPSCSVRISCALVAMGLLDILHAAVWPGNVFVWLHSLATIAGGFFFALMWCPCEFPERLKSWWLGLVGVATTIIGVGSIFFPELIPLMVDNGTFTSTAKFMNLFGGILLFAGALRLYFIYRTTKNIDDLIFFLHCTLFGFAAILFEQSKLWDLAWWGWHVLRLSAYFVALWFVLLTQTRSENEFRDTSVSRDYVDNILGSMNDLLMVIKSDGAIQTVNGATCRILGYEEHELVGEPIEKIIDQEMRGVKGQTIFSRVGLQELLKKGSIVDFGVNYRAKSGEMIPMSLSGSTLSDSSGVLTSVVCVARDLTERKKNEAALASAEREAVTGRLSSMVAHQVNNPLAAMQLRLELLKDDVGDKPVACEMISIIADQITRIATIVQALLGYSRQGAKSTDEIIIPEIIHTVAKLYEGSLESKGINLILYIEESSPPFVGNANDLQEVLVNLLENSRQALDTGTIWISAQQNSGNLEIVVEDNGPGLGPNLNKVFEPYYTTKITGTGIGLSISKRLCKEHGGDLLAENRSQDSGGGALFRIVLPINYVSDGISETQTNQDSLS